MLGLQGFLYSLAGVVLPPSAKKWPNLHQSESPHQSPFIRFLHSPHESFTPPIFTWNGTLQSNNFTRTSNSWPWNLAAGRKLLVPLPPTKICYFCWSLPRCKTSKFLFWITLGTFEHVLLKWLNKFVTSIDFLPHAKD